MLIKEETQGTITINVEHFNFRDEKEIFIHNIRLLNYVSKFNTINEMCLKIESSFKANTSIIYKAIDSLIKNECFDEIELTEYFTAKNDIDLFQAKTYRMIDFDRIGILFEVDFHLLGLKIEDQSKLNEDKNEELHEAYSDLLNSSMQNFDCKDFILKAKELVSKYKEKDC